MNRCVWRRTHDINTLQECNFQIGIALPLDFEHFIFGCFALTISIPDFGKLPYTTIYGKSANSVSFGYIFRPHCQGSSSPDPGVCPCPFDDNIIPYFSLAVKTFSRLFSCLYTYTITEVIYLIDLCNSDNLLVIRSRIKSLCKEKGIKQCKMLEDIGKYESYLSEVWTNRNRLSEDTLSSIANYLRTTPEYLCGLSEDPSRQDQDYSTIVEHPELQKLVDRLMKSDDEVIRKVNAFMDMINA